MYNLIMASKWSPIMEYFQHHVILLEYENTTVYRIYRITTTTHGETIMVVAITFD